MVTHQSTSIADLREKAHQKQIEEEEKLDLLEAVVDLEYKVSLFMLGGEVNGL